MFKTFTIAMNERAVLTRDGLPVRALAPGRHTVLALSGRPDVLRWSVDAVVFQAPAAVLEVLPADGFETVRVGPGERAVVLRDERPIQLLRPGIHRLWKVDGVRVQTLSVAEAVPPLTDELRLVLGSEIVDVTVQQHQRGLKYVQGRFEALLGPGQYVFWTTPQARVAVTVVDQRVQQLTVAGQELMTRDKVTLRLTLTVEYAPSDVATATHAVADVPNALYLAVQLAARDFVAGVTLDALLEQRDALTKFLEAEVVPRAKAYGVAVERVGVKDIILPGEMRTLLNRVIEAEKEAQANVILRREEAAATRSMAQTAKVIAENPVLMRLKELEALREMAGQVGEFKVQLGQDTVNRLIARD